MRKMNFTQSRGISMRSAWMMLVALFFSTFQMQAQTTCNSLVHISLDENCQAIVSADQILEGTYSNIEDYVVTFTNTGLPVILGSGDVGQTYSVTVQGPTGAPCWGNILVEDKLPPTITCDDVILSCTDALPTAPTSAFDACSGVTVTYDDVVQDNGCNGLYATIITRTYTATDDSGNSASCVSTISIERGSLADVVFPPNVDLDCQDNTDPLYTGTPTGTACFNLDYTYLDQSIQICEGSYKLLRTWTVADWCTDQIITHTQIIKVLDTTGPVMEQLPDLNISTTTNSCTANAQLPAIGLSDDCSGGSYDVYIETPLGTINSNGGLLVGAPLGVHTITYYATDACGNESNYSFTVTVSDQIAPIAICDEHTIVSLGSDGTAHIEALTLDDGSLDNCGIVEYKARRMDNPSCPGFDGTSFDDYVPFYCCDLGSTVMVELRVKDEAGNTNSCMVEVEFQDKLAPTIICKPDVNIECDNPLIDEFVVGQPLNAAALGLTGEPVASDNCNVTVTSNVIANTVDCGNGLIKIAWSATDGNGNFDGCFQDIIIVNSDPFYINNNNDNDPTDDVVWPLDYTVSTCGVGLDPSDLPSPYDRPVITEGFCDNIASTYEDQVLNFGAGDACLKIFRKWIIVDWCQAAANQDPTVEGPGVYHYTQVIKVINSTDPIIETFNGATTIDNFDANCGNAFVAFDITASDDCTAAADLEYSWEFSTGLSGTGASASGAFANGSYSLTFTVTDGCGNSSSESRNFIVRDAKKPTPVCIFGLSTVIMPSSGSVQVWASDFESGSSYDNCTAYSDLEFSFSPNVNDKYVDIACADIGADGLYTVQIYVTDAAGNQDYCTTIIQVQDPNGACGVPSAMIISGNIENEFQEEVEDVTVNIDGGNMAPVVTDETGTFEFPQISNGGSYTVTPQKDLNYLNGVTTFDLVLISKHILGIELLDSPYKMIAADANGSESLTTLDLVKLRALILHIDDELANNDSWRFVDASYVFPNPSNPFATDFPEAADFDNMSSSAQANFVAVKIGDVNGTSSPNSLLGTDTRSADGVLAFNVEDKEVKAGKEFTVDFRANNFEVSGYQFALGFENVELVDVATQLEGLTSDNFGFTKLNEGVITTSWNNSRAVKAEDNEVLFSLTFVAQADVTLSEVFTLTSRYTPGEAYNSSELFDVAINFDGSTVNSTAFELLQNTPNPFKAETAIGFNLPEATHVSLKIYDAAGRILKSVEGDYTKGFHTVNVNRNELAGGVGVLYYQLETDKRTATKKMILIQD